MPYCVHCGVELDATAGACPLCQTPVYDPARPVEPDAPPPFPTRKGTVELAATRGDVALLVSVILLSVSVCCGVLNLFFRASHIWSLYIIGAAVMLWLWTVPGLLNRRLGKVPKIVVDVGAVAVYLLFIALANRGLKWYVGLALPLIGASAGLVLLLGLILPKRSILTKLSCLILAAGVEALAVEWAFDVYLRQRWSPGWSVVVAVICVGIVIPLVVIRRVPALREEARRRFHI